jgi:7-cyano-7-deazaguanine synthase
MKILSQLSGGYDSTAVMIKLLDEGHTVKGIFFNYGQKYYKQEKRALEYVDSMLKDNPNYLGYVEIPVEMQLTRNNDGSPSDYIPVRNFVLGAMSANYAIAEGFSTIAVGSKTTEVRKDDPFSFADCSVSFYEHMTNVINLASEPGDYIEFIMPLLKTKSEALTKGEVVNIINDSILEFNDLWSCYEDGDLPCGVCYHCVENKKAFEEAGIEDPISYR